MAEKRDAGLEVHRWTQYIITTATLVLVYMARDIYEDVKSIRDTSVRIEQAIDQHEKRIDKIEGAIWYPAAK
jgi:hypothetical protein